MIEMPKATKKKIRIKLRADLANMMAKIKNKK